MVCAEESPPEGRWGRCAIILMFAVVILYTLQYILQYTQSAGGAGPERWVGMKIINSNKNYQEGQTP